MFPFPFGIWAPIFLPVVLGGHHRKIVPYDLNGPFKQIIMSLFRLAWSSKIRLPLLITVAFLALDVNLQVEINVFWAPGDREGDGGGRDADEEDEAEERRRRRQQNGNRATWHAATGMLPPVAPLAQFEDFDDTEGDDDESDSDSVLSIPENFQIPISRYFLPRVLNSSGRFNNNVANPNEPTDDQDSDSRFSETEFEDAMARQLEME